MGHPENKCFYTQVYFKPISEKREGGPVSILFDGGVYADKRFAYFLATEKVGRRRQKPNTPPKPGSSTLRASYAQLLLTGFFLFSAITAMDAQIGERRDFNWLFGYNSTAPNPNWGATFFDFNHSPPKMYRDSIITDFYLTNASMSDKEGRLLFYTNGCHIADATHQIMENGDSLNPGEIRNQVCTGVAAGYSILQGAIIIPFPNDPDKYYLFHQRKTSIEEPVFAKIVDPLYYSIIDMSLNSGLGTVVQKNEIAIADTLYPGHLTATKHANGTWWWIMIPRWNSNIYHRILIKDGGSGQIHSQEIGLPTTIEGGGSGQAVFSPDGRYYIRYNLADQLYIYDFDRQTGLLSNFRQIEVDSNDYQAGVAVSSNSRFLYVGPLFKVYQFDLWAEDIAASKVVVAEYDGFASPFPTTFWQMQLGPDCRIYIAPPNGTNVMHVIHQPNEKGSACDLEQHGIQLPTYNATGMVNFPNYRLGTSHPPCDPSISTSLPFFSAVEGASFELSPNPGSGEIRVLFSENNQVEGALRLYDALGRTVHYLNLTSGQKSYHWDVSALPAGVYTASWLKNKQRIQSQKLIINK